MQLIEGRLGDPDKVFPWITTLRQVVPVVDPSSSVVALLRGFQVGHTGQSQREWGSLRILLRTLGIGDPLETYVEAEIIFSDELPYSNPFSTDTEDVHVAIDFTLIAYSAKDVLTGPSSAG